MNLRLTTLTENFAKEICNWRYNGDCAIYNYPKWEKCFNEKWAITIEEKRNTQFYAVVDEESTLCGYIRLVDKNEYILIGIGLKPCLCGNGLGSSLMELLKQQCSIQYPNKRIVLEVRSFNERAVRCYKKAGFKETAVYEKNTPIGHGKFIRMEYIK